MQPPSSILIPADEQSIWTVLHCRPRCEKKVVGLQRIRPAVMFLPSIERVHHYGARVRRYEVPLFGGYVFAKLLKEDLSWYRQNQYVANVMEVVDEKKFLQPLLAVACALGEGKPLEVLPQLQPGQKVFITGGSMKGLEAEIGEVKGETCLLLKIELIQQTVALEIDPAFVKPAN